MPLVIPEFEHGVSCTACQHSNHKAMAAIDGKCSKLYLNNTMRMFNVANL